MKRQSPLLVLTIIFYIAALITSCNNNTSRQGTEQPKDSSKVMNQSAITKQPFGSVDNQAVTQFTLTNANGIVVKILDYGGIVTQIQVPDKNGEMGDVVLGFDSLAGWLQKGNPYMGSLVGRYANRIANARFMLEGKTYTLAANNNGNSLHGGLKGFDKVIWKAEPLDGDNSLKLTYSSADGEEGYPGNMLATVVYSLTDSNELKIDYSATSDKPTPVNLTNHTYFNLSAGKDSTILNHELMLNASRYTEANDKLIPTGKLPEVKGTAMDFTSSKLIGRDLATVKGGYDHNYVLNKTGNALSLAATVRDPVSGRFMEMFTTQPGVQFYTSNFLDGSLTGKGGKRLIQHAALCLESQHFPDSPNQPTFPNSILKPGETYHELTIYKFSVK